MELQLSNKELVYEYIWEGDKKDITQEILDELFTGELIPLSAGTSCVYKHILAYRKLVESNDTMALIFEDDVYLKKSFSENLNKIEQEIKSRALKNFVISLEDSNLKYVAGSEKIPNILLYKKLHGRMAGAYLIDRQAANNILQSIKNNKCSVPIDWFHNFASESNLIQIYWSSVILATQGSLDGSIPPTLDNKSTGIFRILSFRIQRLYKKLLYRLI